MKDYASHTKMIVFESLKKAEDKLVSFLDSYFEVSALNYTDDGKEEYVGYVDGAFDEKKLIECAKKEKIKLPTYRVEILENKNWLTENVVKFQPLETSDFCVYGFHEKQAPKTKKIPIKVYAATAFGSTHQTTCLCLKAISDLSRMAFEPKQILDVGTGSGILSIAAAKKWQKIANGAPKKVKNARKRISLCRALCGY